MQRGSSFPASAPNTGLKSSEHFHRRDPKMRKAQTRDQTEGGFDSKKRYKWLSLNIETF